MNDGNVYYYNETTGESSWERPAESDMIPLPPPPPDPDPAASAPGPILQPPPGMQYMPPTPQAPYAPPGGYGVQPSYGAPPAYGMPPAYGAQPPAYGAQPPAYGAQPGYGMPPAPYGAPTPPYMGGPPMHRMGSPEPLPPQPEQEFFNRREDNWPGRAYHKHVGADIHRAQETPLNVRHDIIIEKRCIGRLLGKGARDLEALKAYSQAEVFIIDKHPPPGEGDDHRLLILIGRPSQVRAAKEKVEAVLDRARAELPPLPPPLSSGLRPVPAVGYEQSWQGPDGKRQRNTY